MCAAILLALGCSGEAPTAPRPESPTNDLAVIGCVADVRAQSVSCAKQGDAGGATLSRLVDPASPLRDLIVGGQNVYVRLTSSAVTYQNDVFSFNTTVTNLMPQALGTRDGTTPDAAGVRVFFSTWPVATGGSGTLDFMDPMGDANPANDTSLVTGYATFTQSNQPYYQWSSTILQQNQTTPVKRWGIHVPSSVTSFYFVVYVSAAVQHENGWVSVTPSPTTVSAGRTRQLTAVVRDVRGDPVADQSVTWGTSASGIATVDASGLVTGVADGVATITATGSAGRSGTATVTVVTPSASTTTIAGANFTVGGNSTITVQAKRANGTNITTGGDAVLLSTDLGALTAVTDNNDGTYTATLTSSTSGTAHVTGTINGAAIANPATIVISSAGLAANADSYPQTVIGNVGIVSAQIPYSATTNDALDAGVTVTFAGWNSVAGTTQNGGTVSMVTSGPNRGQFTYDPPAGFNGTDQFTYTLTGGSATASATVSLTVADAIWFVNNNAGACSSACDGRLSHPFTTLAAFQAVNGSGPLKPTAGQKIFLYESAAGYAGPVTLLNGQVLVGQDATASLASIAGLTVPSGSNALPAMNTGGSPTTIAGASGGVTIGNAASAGVHGLTIATTGGTALVSGASFGTLTVGNGLTINNSGGQAVSLNSGSLTGTIASITASAGNAFALSGVSAGLTVTSGALTGSATGPALNVSGGSGTITLGTTLTQTAAAPLLQVASRTSGTLTVSGALSCTTACTGVSVTGNPGGTVALTGASSTINTGASTAITFTGNTAATLQLSGGGLAVTTSSARGLNIAGTGTVTVSGASNSFTSTAGGTPVFASSPFGTLNFDGAVSATSAPAMDLSGGTVNIGQGAGATISSSNSTGKGLNLSTLSGTATIGGTGVTGSTGTGVDVSGGTATLSLGFPVTKTSAGALVAVTSHATNGVTFSGTLSCTGTCTGMNVANNTSGAITFSGTSKTFSTSGTAAVSLSNNGSATVSFPNGGLAISTTTGTAFSATGGGTVTVGTGASPNTILTTGSGSGLVVQNTTIGAAGLTFRSITTGANAANGILLDNTGTTAGLTVTGNAGTCTQATPNCTGGIIDGTSGADGGTSSGIYLRSTVNPTLSFMRVKGTHGNFGIYAKTVSGLGLISMVLDGTFGSAQASYAADSTVAEGALSMDELSGTDSVVNSYFANGNWSNVRLHNASAATTLRGLKLSGNTFGKTRDAINAFASLDVIVDAGTDTLSVLNNTFAGAIKYGVVFRPTGGALNLTFSNNTMTQTMGSYGALGNVYPGFTQLYLFPTGTDASSGTITYTFANNNLQGSQGSALKVLKDVGNWTMTGQITGNTIGTSTTNKSGSAIGAGIDITHATVGKHKVLVSGNHVKQYNGNGMFVGMQPPLSATGAARNGSLHITITGNDFTVPDPAADFVDAINFNPVTFTNTQHTLCVNLGVGGANTLTGFKDGSLPGAPYSIGDPGGSNAVGAFLKVLNLAGGPYTNNSAANNAAAASAVDAVWAPANTTGGRASYIEFGTMGMVTTSASDGARGTACDLF